MVAPGVGGVATGTVVSAGGGGGGGAAAGGGNDWNPKSWRCMESMVGIFRFQLLVFRGVLWVYPFLRGSNDANLLDVPYKFVHLFLVGVMK